ncbi:hypothetical protein V8F20_002775 [Naviculisporaceae sp. PSN 640]
MRTFGLCTDMAFIKKMVLCFHLGLILWLAHIDTVVNMEDQKVKTGAASLAATRCFIAFIAFIASMRFPITCKRS